MKTASRIASVFGVLVVAGVSSATVLGTFEGGVAEAGWGHWDGGVQTPLTGDPALSFSTEQATNGVYSIKVMNEGFEQTLAYNAGAAGTIAAFEANNVLTFDVIFTKDISPNGGSRKSPNLR